VCPGQPFAPGQFLVGLKNLSVWQASYNGSVRPSGEIEMLNRCRLGVALVLMMCAASSALGGVTVSLVTAGGSDTSVTVAPGAGFSVDLRVQVSEVVITGVQLQLEASAAHVLDVTDGSYNAAAWDTGLMAVTIGPMTLDTVGATPLFTAPMAVTMQNSTNVFATVNLTVEAEASPGTYTLNATSIMAFDQAFADVGGTAGPGFSVIVSSGGTPPSGGGGTTPPDGGGTTPPDDGGTTPPDDGGTNPPDGGGTNPPDGGGTSQPSDGGSNPPDGGVTTPVVGRCGAGMIESLALSLTALLVFRSPGRRHRPK
jgi:hypothetical protein